LKDFKTLPRTIAKISNFLGDASKTLRGIIRDRWGRRISKQGVRTASDAYLQSQFNILPLISDIVGLSRAIRSTEAEMYRLLKNAARPQQKYFKHTFDELRAEQFSHVNYYQTPDFNWPWFGSICEAYSAPEQTVFNAEIEYNYYYPQFMLEHARVLALLDSLGVNLNPAIIWNAIPWSFVVDWVVNVSSWLNQFKVSAFEPVINIQRACWSVKRVRRTHATMTVGIGAHHRLHKTRTTMPVVTETAYRRYVMMPTLSSLSASGLNIKEFSLGVALVFSRPRRRR
jgi:hypothetical protein